MRISPFPSLKRLLPAASAALAIGLACGAPFALGDFSEELRRLLDQPHRPTMAQIRDQLSVIPAGDRIALEAITDAGVARSISDGSTPMWTQKLLENGPELIASAEKAFPGATWAFLGRDAVAYADLFEAFYLSIGQTDRVVRIGISGTALRGLKVGSPELLELLESNGFSLSSYASAAPFILVDTLSKGGGSQGRLLLGTAYQAAQAKGLNLGLLVWKLNMLGLVTRTFTDAKLPQNPVKSAEYSLAAMAQDLIGFTGRDLLSKLQVITYPDPGNFANEASYVHFVGGWHDSFVGYERDKNGKLLPIPGDGYSDELKLNVLWMQRKIWRTVNQRKYLERVQAAAKSIGYEFPLTRVVQEISLEDLEQRAFEATLKRNNPGKLGHHAKADLERRLRNRFRGYNWLRSRFGEISLSMFGWFWSEIDDFRGDDEQSVSERSAISIELLRAMNEQYVAGYVNANDLRGALSLAIAYARPSWKLVSQIERAFTLVPSLAQGWAAGARAMTKHGIGAEMAGTPEEVEVRLRFLERALKLKGICTEALNP